MFSKEIILTVCKVEVSDSDSSDCEITSDEEEVEADAEEADDVPEELPDTVDDEEEDKRDDDSQQQTVSEPVTHVKGTLYLDICIIISPSAV